VASYHLWHPSYVVGDPLTLELFVTQGDALLAPAAGTEVAKAALEALGLDVTPRASRLEEMRTHYFSSHRGETGDWRDAWDLVWRLRTRLVVDRAPTLPAPPGGGYFDLDKAPGAMPNDTDRAWPCLLLADASESKTIDEAEAIVRRSHPDADCVRGRAYTRYPQLRAVVGSHRSAWYERGAEEAEAILESIAAETGASVHFDGLRAAD
jgi:hypothetical protein